MKKLLVCMVVALCCVTGCQASTDKKDLTTSEKAAQQTPAATPGILDSIRIEDETYDVHKTGKEIKKDDNRSIYFSNEALVCYAKTSANKMNNETFYLYDRKTGKQHRIITVSHLETCWGSMYEKDGCLYLAMGRIVHKKEASYILKIEEETFHGELIRIKECNTIFSSVICSDNTLFVWFMNEKNDIKEYYLTRLDGETLTPVHSWIYNIGSSDTDQETQVDNRNQTGIGQAMSVFGTNGNALFCYVYDEDDNAWVEIYDGTGELTKTIPVTFADFQDTSDGKDGFSGIYCCGNTLFFQTYNHRILIAEYDGNQITRIDGDELFAESGDSDVWGGSYNCVSAFSDKMIIGGMLDYTNQLICWDIPGHTMRKIVFNMKDEEVLSYQMLSENEVLVSTFYKESESREYYCKLK